MPTPNTIPLKAYIVRVFKSFFEVFELEFDDTHIREDGLVDVVDLVFAVTVFQSLLVFLLEVVPCVLGPVVLVHLAV